MRIIDLEQGSPEWLLWREAGIGASECAAIMGRSSYQSTYRLWQEKTGKVDPPDLSRNPHVIRGHALEDDARIAVEKYLNKGVIIPCCAESKSHPFIRASFDGLTIDNEPVELKAPCDSVAKSVMKDQWDSKHVRMYWCQVQQQLYVSGAERGWLAFYFGKVMGQDNLIVFPIERDEAFIAEMVEALETFWHCVLNQAPPNVGGKPVFQPEDTDTEAKELAIRYHWLQGQHKSLADQANEHKTQMDEIKQNMVDLMGESLKADYFGVEVTRSETQRTDYKRYAAALVKKLEESNLDVPNLDDYKGETFHKVRVHVHKEKDNPVAIRELGKVSGFF